MRTVIYDEKWIQLDEQLHRVIVQVKQTPEYKRYIMTKKKLNQPEIQRARQDVIYYNEKLDERGDYMTPQEKNKVKRQLIKAKRQYDMIEEVRDYHQAMYDIQQLLDDILENITRLFSEEIMIDYGNPLNKKGCQGGC